MYIHFSSPAAAQIRAISNLEIPMLRLAYDNEGCGCAVNGVPQLRIIVQTAVDDVQASSNERFTIYYNRHHAIYFEDHLQIGYSSERSAFRLTSDAQIYTNHLVVVDERSPTCAP